MPIQRTFAVLSLCLLSMGQASKPRPVRPVRSTAELRTSARFETLKHDPAALRGFLRAFPKGADLHTHLGGAVYAESYIAWAAELSLCVDTRTFAIVASAGGAAPDTKCRSATDRPAADALADPALYASLVDAMSMRNFDPSSGGSAGHFFASFDKFGQVLRAGGDRIQGESMAELVQRAGSQHVQHVEVMIGVTDSTLATAAAVLPPGADSDLAGVRQRLLASGLADAVAARRRWVDAVEDVVRRRLACGTPQAREGCDVSVRHVAVVLRALPPAQVFAQMLTAFELAATDSRVVGVNIAQPEDWLVPRRDYDRHMRMLAFLHATYPGVKLTLHAGELALGQVPPEDLGQHVRKVVESGLASRVGHGADAMYDPRPTELLDEMARRRIAVEINLSSNDYILGLRGARHPLRSYLRAGVPVVLCTDDEGVSRSDLTNEYQRAVEEHGLSYAELKRISRNGVEHSFLPDADKIELRARLEKALDAFERSF